jgi:hypothetical protein
VKQEVFRFADISGQELLQKGLKMLARIAAQKPLLNKKTKKKMLAFCKKYLKWTPKQWENVIFSDDSTFCLVNSRGTKVRRPSGISCCKQLYTSFT